MKIREDNLHIIFEFGDRQMWITKDFLKTPGVISGKVGLYHKQTGFCSTNNTKNISGAELDKMYTDNNLYYSSSKEKILISGMADQHLMNAIHKLEREGKTAIKEYKYLVKEAGRRQLDI